MKRAEFNAALRAHSKAALTPTANERALVTLIYGEIQEVLGASNCLQIGSYPRFTAITPLHDLDVLYMLGPWVPGLHDPRNVLAELERKLRAGFTNPTRWQLSITRQTHSITLSFLEGATERMSVDIVPGHSHGINEFGQDMYAVPEIVRQSHAARAQTYSRLQTGQGVMQWIRSDPRGYIEIAKRTNDANSDFRKAVKLAKAWHYSCKKLFDSKLKSFHIEQIITAHFQRPEMDVFGALFEFFVTLPDAIKSPRIPDRADPTRFIDEYLNGLGLPERRLIIEARDGFLIKLENFSPGDSVRALLQATLRERKSSSESYLFDQRIPTFTEAPLTIDAHLLEREGGFRAGLLSSFGRIATDRRIEFRVHSALGSDVTYKWKVKNDDNSPQPRGEITDNRTLNDPEHSKYPGDHYVECYAIRAGVCIAKARQMVRL